MKIVRTALAALAFWVGLVAHADVPFAHPQEGKHCHPDRTLKAPHCH